VGLAGISFCLGELKIGRALTGEGTSSSSSSILSYYCKSKVVKGTATLTCGAFEAGEAGWWGAVKVLDYISPVTSRAYLASFCEVPSAAITSCLLFFFKFSFFSIMMAP